MRFVSFYSNAFCWVIHRWLPLGVLDRGFIRSSGVMLEVNDFGVIIGGETYQAEDDFQELEASDEVKLLNPSGPHFSLWDLPCLLEPRTKHAAAAVPGNLVFRPLEFCQHRCCRCHGRPPLSRQYAPESTTPTQCHSCGGRTIVRFEDYIELTFSPPPHLCSGLLHRGMFDFRICLCDRWL